MLAERPPRKPDCLAGGGRGLRHAAQAPRCSLMRSASVSLGGSSVNSLTRLPYLQEDYLPSGMLSCYTSTFISSLLSARQPPSQAFCLKQDAFRQGLTELR